MIVCILVLKSKFAGDREKKSGSPSGLTTAAKLDHSCAMQVLQQCIGPRLSQEVYEYKYYEIVHYISPSTKHPKPNFNQFREHKVERKEILDGWFARHYSIFSFGSDIRKFINAA